MEPTFRSRRRSWLPSRVLVVVALLSVGAPAAWGQASSMEPAPAGPSPFGGAPSPGAAALLPSLGFSFEQLVSDETARQQAEAYRVYRQSDAAKAQRLASRTAHQQRSRAEALALAREKHPQITERPIWRPIRLAQGQRVAEFIGELGARVKDENGRQQVLESTAPLRSTVGSGKQELVDLGLEEQGEAFEPENPLVSTRIAKRAEQGVRFDKRNLGLAVEGAQGEPAMLHKGRVFQANVLTDIDLIVEPQPRGVELSFQVRSAAAPEELRLRVDLPTGARLRISDGKFAPAVGAAPPTGSPPGEAEIVRDGKLLASVSAPVFYDTDGEALDASYAVDGEVLILRFPHRSKDVFYPAILDPQVDNYQLDQTNGDGARCSWDATPPVHCGEKFLWGNGISSWTYGHYGGATNEWMPFYQKLYAGAGEDTGAVGFLTYKNGNYGHLQYGQISWTAPRQSTITNAHFGYVDHSPNGFLTSCVVEGVYSVSQARWQEGTWGEDPDYGGETGASPWFLTTPITYDDRNPCWYQTNNYKSHSFTTSQQIPGNPAFVFQFKMNGTGVRPAQGIAEMYGASIWLDDRTNPQVASHTVSASGWVKGGTTVTHSVSAWDGPPSNIEANGLGMAAMSVLPPKAGGGTGLAMNWANCNDWNGVTRVSHCRPDFTTNLSYNVDDVDPASGSQPMPEGTNSVGGNATDILWKSTALPSRTVKVDRTQPALIPSLDLWERRNQSGVGADHRNEGIYAKDNQVKALATEPSTRSGVKRVEIWFNNQLKSYTEDPCTSQCPTQLQADWTLDADSVPDGDYEVKIRAKDLAGNWAPDKTWTVTIDRRGDVYHATQYDGNPATDGESLRDEWAQLGTRLARAEEPTVVKTNNYLPCDDAEPNGARCLEERTATRLPGGGDLFTVYIGAREDDPRIETVTDIFAYTRLQSSQADGRGPIAEVMEPWQHRPPGAGSEYERYELPVTETVSGDIPTETDDPGEEATLTGKIWLDAQTRAPLKEVIVDSTGASVSDRYWSYAGARKSTSEYAADFFTAQRPSNVQQDKTVDMRPRAARGMVPDTETGGGFTGYWLGNSVSLAAGTLCLAATHVTKLNEFGTDSIIQGDPLFPGSPMGPLTLVGTAYNLLSLSESCTPGYGNLEGPDIEVHAVARASTEAAGWHEDYVRAAEAIQSDPSDPDHERAGVVDLTIAGQTVTAYVIPLGDRDLGVLLDLGTATIEVVGKLTKADLTTTIRNVLGVVQ